MNTFMLGSFTLNFLISFSMKKLLNAIRVLQMIAFMVFLDVGFSPISLLFIQQIYRFVTFKVVPDEIMNSILLFLGLKTVGSGRDGASAGRRLQESIGGEGLVVIEEQSFLQDLNFMLFGAVGSGSALIVGVIVLWFLRKNRKIKRKL